jgi:hypothetical protein
MSTAHCPAMLPGKVAQGMPVGDKTMRRNLITFLVILSLGGSTLVGCNATTFLQGSNNPLFGLEIIPVQLMGALLLDQFVGPLFGDPAGDLFQHSGSSATTPQDN